MTWRHWIAIVLGAGAGVAVAVGLRKLRIYTGASVTEAQGSVVY
ncbi:MAG TPA: hypothetical protein VES65_11380 [Solirubrobacteraceae bacterium]|nr:hypothetical protein [Solirubrobacteraceae bacterium]